MFTISYLLNHYISWGHYGALCKTKKPKRKTHFSRLCELQRTAISKRRAFSFCISVITYFQQATRHLNIRGAEKMKIAFYCICCVRLEESLKWNKVERVWKGPRENLHAWKILYLQKSELCVCVYTRRSRCFCIRKIKWKKSK